MDGFHRKLWDNGDNRELTRNFSEFAAPQEKR